MSAPQRYLPALLSIYIAFVFIQSLFFKFIDAPETQLIFGTLDAWAAGVFGVEGLFAPGGVFSAKVIGSLELVAAIALLLGLFVPGLRMLNALGALLAFCIISGAIFFHLFTPLGIVVGDEQVAGVRQGEVATDGGLLFFMAVGVWIASAILIGMGRDRLLSLIGRN